MGPQSPLTPTLQASARPLDQGGASTLWAGGQKSSSSFFVFLSFVDLIGCGGLRTSTFAKKQHFVFARTSWYLLLYFSRQLFRNVEEFRAQFCNQACSWKNVLRILSVVRFFAEPVPPPLLPQFFGRLRGRCRKIHNTHLVCVKVLFFIGARFAKQKTLGVRGGRKWSASPPSPSSPAKSSSL